MVIPIFGNFVTQSSSLFSQPSSRDLTLTLTLTSTKPRRTSPPKSYKGMSYN